MSGAEAFAVISIIINVLDLINYSNQVLSRVDEFSAKVKDVPKAFRNLKIVLPVIADTLSRTKSRIDAREVDEKTCTALRPVVIDCEAKLVELKALFEKILPKDNASWFTIRWKALSSIRHDKNVEAISIAIQRCVDILTMNFAEDAVLTAKGITKSIANLTISNESNTNCAKGENVFQVPFCLTDLPCTSDYITREDEMTAMEQILRPGVDETMRKIFTLHGLGGIGKTQMAVAFARKHKDEYSAIFWIDGDSISTLLASLSALLPRLPGQEKRSADPGSLEKAAKSAMRWFDEVGNKKWLLIYDNVDRFWSPEVTDSEAYDITTYFPSSDQGSIIITTRLKDFANLGGDLEVPRVSFEQGLDILCENAKVPRSVEGIEKIVEELDNLPLALVQAGRYLFNTKMSPSKYLRLYRESWLSLQKLSPQLRDYKNRTVHTTWTISYEQICKESETAARLLRLWAYLHKQDLWYELLHESAHLQPAWYQEIVQDELIFESNVETLLRYSLIESHSAPDSYAVHSVVHKWCLESLLGKDEGQLIQAACIAVGYLVPDDDKPEFWILQRRLLPHAMKCLHFSCFPPTSCSWDSVDAPHHLDKLGTLFYTQGKYEQAGHMYQLVFELSKNMNGLKHKTTLDSMNKVGMVLHNQGKYKEAEQLHQQTLVARNEVLGPKYPDTLGSMNNLASVLRDQGKYREAEELHQQTLVARNEVLGPKHPDTLDSMHNLAIVLYDQGKYREAEELHQQTLVARNEVLGPKHPDTLGSMNNLASGLRDQGKYREAEELYRQTLVAKNEVLGPEHPDTLGSMHNLALVLHDQGKYREAEELQQQTLVARNEVLGPKHPDTLGSMNNLASGLRDQGKYREAEELYRQTLVAKNEVLGPRHPDTLDGMHNLALVLRNQGKYREAEKLHQQTLVARNEVLGPEHPDTFISMHNLAIVLYDQGKYREAEELHQRTLVARNEVLGPEHPDTLNTLYNLALSL